MYRRLTKAITLGLVSALGLVPLTGCSSGPDGQADAASGTGMITDVPPIHLEQTLVTLADGKPQAEQIYRKALADCQRAGQSVTPLSEEDVAKVGRTFERLWFEGARMAERGDSWSVADGPTPCQFKLAHDSSSLMVDDGKTRTSVDMLKGTAEQEPSDGGRAALADDDDKLDAASAQSGVQRLGEASDAGQRCLHWRSASGTESCAWSGGHRWGFSAAEGSDQATSYDPGRIVLWVKPADGNGPQLSTEKMTVGGTPDDEAFKLPSNISIGKAN